METYSLLDVICIMKVPGLKVVTSMRLVLDTLASCVGHVLVNHDANDTASQNTRICMTSLLLITGLWLCR